MISNQLLHFLRLILFMFSTASIDSIDVVFGAFWGISIGFILINYIIFNEWSSFNVFLFQLLWFIRYSLRYSGYFSLTIDMIMTTLQLISVWKKVPLCSLLYYLPLTAGYSITMVSIKLFITVSMMIGNIIDIYLSGIMIVILMVLLLLFLLLKLLLMILLNILLLLLLLLILEVFIVLLLFLYLIVYHQLDLLYLWVY